MSEAFAAAVRNAETGSFDGAYDKVQGLVRQARKVGAYGIASDEWDALAESAGIAGARWADQRAQDRVARVMFQALHQKYGDWRLVAAAWKGGEELADKIAGNPSLLDHPNLKELKAYVDTVMTGANDYNGLTPSTGPNPLTGPAPEAYPTMADGLTSNQDGTLPQQQSDGQVYMRRVLTAMRNKNRKRAARMADTGADDTQPVDERSSSEPEVV